ncbi:MAG: SMP-30/gluconolactonase/LRE family protein [Planctomycetes bacterium]|nr:SMP-30/gluconolactonase/LRE family protein [Planctomycetota bacterium]
MTRSQAASIALGLALMSSCSTIPAADEVFEEGSMRTLATGLGFTEGPVWIATEDRLVFSDIPSAKLMSWTEEDGVAVFRESPNPNGNLLDHQGRLLTCRHGARDVVRTEPDGSITILASGWDGRRFNSPNDLAVDLDGDLWFTDPPWGLPGQREGRELDENGVYRLEVATGEVTRVSTLHAMPNGIALSPLEDALYVTDTGGHPSHPDEARRTSEGNVTCYAMGADGSLSVRWQAPVISDGLAVDEFGRVFTTTGGGIVVLAPSTGEVVTTLEVPEQPANCCFGGSDGRTLFITARTGLYSVRTAAAGAR